MKNNTLHGLTIFRFVAALYVFVFHCNLRFPVSGPKWILDIINNGAIGMTFFFVLSGFVMAWSSRMGIRPDYLKSRILRIYPAYLFMGVLSAPFLVGIPLIKIIPILSLYITGTQSWIPQSFTEWNFIGSWSVSTELFFYMAFPLIFPLIKKMPFLFLCSSFAATSLLIPFTIMISGHSEFPIFYVSPIHRFPEFVFGASLGVLFTNGLTFPSRRSKIIGSIASVFVLSFISTKLNAGFMNMNIFTVIATGMLVYSLASSSIKDSGINKVFIYLGKVSYSFYLMQIPIIMFIEKYRYLFDHFSTMTSWFIMAAANLALAVLSYHFIEEKFIMKYKAKSNNEIIVKSTS